MVDIIMEVGSIHDGSYGNAEKAIRFANEIGVDVVKFQMHLASDETTRYAPNPDYFKEESRYEYFERTAFTISQWKKLKNLADEIGIRFLVSPFSIKAVDYLSDIGIREFKIASGETSNIPLLEALNKKKFKVIFSTGMSTFDEIALAVSTLDNCESIDILQCTSKYPCPLEEVGLNVITDLKQKFPNCGVGFSDHTSGFSSSIGAVLFGATIIEKHFSFSNLMYGSDAKFGLEPDNFRQFVIMVREAEILLQSKVKKEITPELLDMKKTFEKSIVYSRDLESEQKIEIGHILFKKPGDGIPAREYNKIIGKVLKYNVFMDQQVNLKDFK